MSMPLFFLNTAPGPITDMRVAIQSSSSDIQIKWSPPMDVTGALVGYTVTVGKFEQPNGTALYNWNGKNTSVTVSADGLGKERALVESAATLISIHE